VIHLLDTTTWCSGMTMSPSLGLYASELQCRLEPGEMMITVTDRVVLEEELRGVERFLLGHSVPLLSMLRVDVVDDIAGYSRVRVPSKTRWNAPMLTSFVVQLPLKSACCRILF
jgi:hypothetical protein